MALFSVNNDAKDKDTARAIMMREQEIAAYEEEIAGIEVILADPTHEGVHERYRALKGQNLEQLAVSQAVMTSLLARLPEGSRRDKAIAAILEE